jgi:chemotaxis protein MotA
MLTLPIGILATLAVLFFAVDLKSWGLFLNIHSMIIVFGGTLAILLFATPTTVLKALWAAVRNLFSDPPTFSVYLKELEELSRTKVLSVPSKNELVNYAAGLWESGVTPDLFQMLIHQRCIELEERGMDAVQALRHLAKYPPAFGMTGTVVGLVGLFSQLGGDAKSTLGPALALAMTATFFGLAVANGIVQPLADRLVIAGIMERRVLTGILQALTLINRGDSWTLANSGGDDAGDNAA